MQLAVCLETHMLDAAAAKAIILGGIYTVLEEEGDQMRILNHEGRYLWYPKACFGYLVEQSKLKAMLEAAPNAEPTTKGASTTLTPSLALESPQ